ncbi:MAG: membrane protein insertase YidC [Gammaproteobacteria bacterium]|nr:membrane protein insertase YidC [Gammaproteobacteria bacterium]
MEIWASFVHLLEQVLLAFYHWTGNAGLAIIIFTVIVRLLILPLTLQSLQSSRKIQEIQPLIKDLQRKHGKDQQRLQEETVKLYREYKINPAGGCLPMFLQLPMFLAVYQAVMNLTRVSPTEHAGSAMLDALRSTAIAVPATIASFSQPQLAGGFLWLPDLGKTDPLHILPVLSVVFQLLVQLMATPRVQDPQQKALAQSMLIMPIVFGYIGFTFPSGAVLYWVIGSILSMLQQYVISGWGSLANYLKFLPTTGGLFPPIIPAGATAGSAAAHAPAVDGEAQRAEFWEVLRPLMDSPTDAPTGDGAADAEEPRRVVEPMNPRRRKARG